jgi:hypothetical protein
MAMLLLMDAGLHPGDPARRFYRRLGILEIPSAAVMANCLGLKLSMVRPKPNGVARKRVFVVTVKISSCT